MGWIIFFVFSVMISILCISFKKWKYYWSAGMITLIILYAIDSTLIELGAFSYRYPNPLIGNLPILYWLSGFFGGAILVYFYPEGKQFQFPYFLNSIFLVFVLRVTYVIFRVF